MNIVFRDENCRRMTNSGFLFWKMPWFPSSCDNLGRQNNLVCYYYDFSENECLNSKPKMIIFWLSMQVLTSLSLYKLPGIQWSHEVHLTWKANCVPHYRYIPDMKFIGDGQINHKNFIARKAIYEIMVNKIKYSGSML